MKALDVANCLIDHYGQGGDMTSLRINRLVYFAQAVSLQQFHQPLFDDAIQAWQDGPVQPDVYHAFQRYGRGCVRATEESYTVTPLLEDVAETLMNSYGQLSTFDLVRLAHGDGSAWSNVYDGSRDVAVITDRDILDSVDGKPNDRLRSHTLTEGFEHAMQKWPNTMKLLEDD
ncbi:Panacea domain-containing protein [Bifidobacterium choloepi]|uniref:Panacea domain-containing protein n=1 Tax=Bifidobacterium choloepi TaxID=2614131 RepID=UPI0013D3613B|nr:type II toxin-antitoxin system antitoxin SocA domain-containing protein [Bifidobacterium choloepi]